MSIRSVVGWLGAMTLLAASYGDMPASPVTQDPRPTALVGLSAPSRLAAVGAEQSGTIVEMPVTEGTRVVAGDLLFRLSSKLQELEVARLEALSRSNLDRERAQAGVQHVTDKLNRMRELSAKDIASRSTVDEVELESRLAHLALGLAELERTQLDNQLEQARERLQQRTLRSPFVGVVTRRFKQAGETIEQLAPVVEVISLDPLWIEFECPVAAAQAYRKGNRVKVRPAVGVEAPREAQIIYLSWKATPASHTLLVRASLPNEDYSWRAGLKMLIEALPSAATMDVPASPPGGK